MTIAPDIELNRMAMLSRPSGRCLSNLDSARTSAAASKSSWSHQRAKRRQPVFHCPKRSGSDRQRAPSPDIQSSASRKVRVEIRAGLPTRPCSGGKKRSHIAHSQLLKASLAAIDPLRCCESPIVGSGCRRSGPTLRGAEALAHERRDALARNIGGNTHRRPTLPCGGRWIVGVAEARPRLAT